MELKPENIDALNDRGTCYIRNKKTEEGMLDYSKALEIDPKNADTYYFRGSSYFFFLANTDSAIADLNRAVEYNPKFKIAFNLRGTVYSIKMDFDKAIEDANTAISIDPDYSSPYVTRGGIYYMQEKYELALADFEKMKSLSPELFRINAAVKKMYDDCKVKLNR